VTGLIATNNCFSGSDVALYEAERCAHQLHKPQQGKGDDEHIIRVFARLMLKGRVRAAVHWMTEHQVVESWTPLPWVWPRGTLKNRKS